MKRPYPEWSPFEARTIQTLRVSEEDLREFAIHRPPVKDSIWLINHWASRYFCREMSFDMRCPGEEDVVVLMETEQVRLHGPDPKVIGGVAVFCPNEYEDIIREVEWCCAYVWVHPFDRGRGLFRKWLPKMEDAFGENFIFTPPYSPHAQHLMDAYPEVGKHDAARYRAP